MTKDIYRLHAEVCKTLSHAKRLEILNILRHAEMSAGGIVKRMKVSKANASQHLAILRNAGILETRRDGVSIYYRLSSPKVIDACDLMREVLLEKHVQRHALLKRFTTQKGVR
ncbi:MAG: metalloregulator ArsR/SmtB family transcription factor [Bacteroidota bacterium]